jgi:hypothetical protein
MQKMTGLNPSLSPTALGFWRAMAHLFQYSPRKLSPHQSTLLFRIVEQLEVNPEASVIVFEDVPDMIPVKALCYAALYVASGRRLFSLSVEKEEEPSLVTQINEHLDALTTCGEFAARANIKCLEGDHQQ